MKGAQILAMLDQGLRLSRPMRCPEPIYAIMQQCWNFEGLRRPTFTELVTNLSQILKSMLCSSQTQCLQIHKSSHLKLNSLEEFGPRHEGMGTTSCTSSGGSGVNSVGSEGISF